MIPYFSFESFSLGPLTIHVWGLFVSLGIIIGAWLSAQYAAKKGIDKDLIYNTAFWIIVGAFLGARIFHVFFYEPGFYLENPAEILRIWNGGLSVMGGFAGALTAFFIQARQKKFDLLKTADVLIYGLPLGLGCGRIGCFLIHDHPGTATDFFLGVSQPDGGAIHDHGLYLSINGFVLALVFFLFSRRQTKEGFFVTLFLIWYGVVRFILDFWRAADSMYFGLTPAQYFSIFMILGGLILARHLYSNQRMRPEST